MAVIIAVPIAITAMARLRDAIYRCDPAMTNGAVDHSLKISAPTFKLHLVKTNLEVLRPRLPDALAIIELDVTEEG